MDPYLPIGAKSSDPVLMGAHQQVSAMPALEPIGVPIGRALSLIHRNLWVVILILGLGLGGAAVVLKSMPKQYTAGATILIEPQRTQVSDLQAISPDPGDVASLLRTQIDILRSTRLALGVVRALDLTSIPVFQPHSGGIKAMLFRALQAVGLSDPVPHDQLTPQQADQVAALVLQDMLSFTNEAHSSVLGVSVTTGNAALSAAIANEVAKQFLDFKRNEKFAAMQRAHDWFQEQLGTLGDQVHAADLAAENYRRQHGLEEQPPDTGTGERTVSANRQQLDAISRQLSDVSRERALKEGQLAQAQAVLKGAMPASALPEVLTSTAVAGLISQIAAASGREAQLETAQGANNPELVATRALVARLQAKLQQEMGNIVMSLTASVQAARSQEASLRTELEKLRRAVADENSAEVGLQELQAKARATRGIYESFLTRVAQLANVAGIQEPDAALVSSAQVPLTPSSPKTMQVLVLAAMGSMVIGIALAVMIERLRPGFGEPEVLEAALGLPMLAVMPRVSAAGQAQAETGPPRKRSAIMLDAALDKLRGQLRALGEKRPTVVMVTSALPQEGKSVFAARFARNAARAGWRVMLVECDFRRPSIARAFGLPPGAGLSQILNGTLLGSEDAVLHTPMPHLHVLPAGWVQGDPQELLASRRMEALLATARERYDLVVLDTPPVLPVADALVLSSRADATLMLVRWEKTPRSAVQDAVRMLRDSRARILGTVMTRVSMRTAQIVGGRISHALGYYDSYHARQKHPQVRSASAFSPK
ncbi:MAG: polysaccharide biosynthesis tyrosine autokinase [Proteobacteria bacterium]|nr:polysaccharide biosynthesis tyrosine autokinase [Pseudomonadota bacterium]